MIPQDPQVAIVHDQLTQYGGAEKTLEQLLALFPTADIFTGYCNPSNISTKILGRRIVSGLGGQPVWVQKLVNYLSFLMPFVFESLDLRNYNIIISEGTAWPKGVITNPEQLHISYVYTPPRFLYGYRTEGQKRAVWYYKPFLTVIDYVLRLWDFSAAHRPDFMVSISQEVANRVHKFYRRDSTVIYPPVEVATTELQNESSADYYVCISRLAAYKNIDVLIQACNKTNLSLKIAGTGKEEARLKALAKENVTLLGFVTESEKARLLAQCKGFIFPTDHEDFGIVTVEALAYGKPVLAHRSGGQLEIVADGVTGMFFDELTPDALAKTLIAFDKAIDAKTFDPKQAQAAAAHFSAARFKKEFGEFVNQKWEEKQHARTA
jgi:glycosyltransferase involved in cell wall biosynthesis